tara:strand:- start:155 stop:1714 length:1560 start_codon:yes stop_codon:yes gene_type:complete
MSINLKEKYPLEQRYASGGASPTMRRQATPNRRKSRETFDIVQKLDSTNAIEIFEATETKGKSAMSSPENIVLENQGDAAIGLTLQVPIWTDDTTQSGSNYLQILLPRGKTISLPTTRIIDSADANFMDGTVVSNTAPNSNMYVDSTADTDDTTATDNVDNSATNTTVYLEPYTSAANCTANLFRVGDLIRIRDEIMEVTAIGDKSDLANNTLTVIRGVHGSTATTNTDDEDPVRLAFFNAYADFDKFSTARTDHNGKFKAMNFFGYGRALTVEGSGILPGSINIKFYKPGYQEFGMSGISYNTNSGLAASTAYAFNITVDGGSTFANLSFTTDSSNVNFGGTNGIISKIQNALDTQYYTAGNLFEKRVYVSLINGDIRFTSGSRLSSSAILLAAPGSGTTPFGVGRLPAIADIESAVAAKLPDDVIYDSKSYDSVPNTSEFMWDDGDGNLTGVGSGTINYDTGEVNFTAYPDAEFVVSVAHSSGLAGRAGSSASNIIEKVYARSANAKVEALIGMKVE